MNFTKSLEGVFLKFGLGEEMQAAKKIALKDIDMLEDGEIFDKIDALAEVIDPVTRDLGNITG
jgi:hypothetical protein